MNRLAITLFTLILLTGCSSGGGTAGGAGGDNTAALDGGLFLVGSVVPNDSISIDTVRGVCVNIETGEVSDTEPGQSTVTGTFTVNVADAFDATSHLFPSGVVFETYNVSYTGESSSAPSLSSHNYTSTISLLNGVTEAETTVVLADLGGAIREFREKSPGDTIYSYRVTVRYSGRTVEGESIILAASTFLEFGNFDTCT